MKPFLLFVFCTLYALALQARQQDVSVVSRLNAQIRPIQTLRADSSFEDIAFLEEKLRDKDLIGLGEVTHGTAEVFRYKDRLVRFLVSRMGFRAIAFESDFIAMENIDAYINGKTDSLTLLSGTALGGSNRPMINWLRAYNLERKATDRVHVFGVELRELGNISRKLVRVIPGLSAADSLLLKNVALQPYNKLTRQDQEALGSLIARLNTSQLPELQRHYLDMLKQVLLYAKTKMSYRDAAMHKT
ncbi:hypothetical protein C7T94_11070 [Pedobacter yulinensis]|uniref:Erythromycin esterase n=1 Tax=Pedobacter yulinensis TaxID=2126353 RepID=A0A2T3HL20_9SPHI|nr:erythromycin esterase family protein [Pedobacter yulinensis]PST83137.1 hypothetical protein C7T94_11070 [Pedobacter yulinensis]